MNDRQAERVSVTPSPTTIFPFLSLQSHHAYDWRKQLKESCKLVKPGPLNHWPLFMIKTQCRPNFERLIGQLIKRCWKRSVSNLLLPTRKFWKSYSLFTPKQPPTSSPLQLKSRSQGQGLEIDGLSPGPQGSLLPTLPKSAPDTTRHRSSG